MLGHAHGLVAERGYAARGGCRGARRAGAMQRRSNPVGGRHLAAREVRWYLSKATAPKPVDFGYLSWPRLVCPDAQVRRADDVKGVCVCCNQSSTRLEGRVAHGQLLWPGGAKREGLGANRCGLRAEAAPSASIRLGRRRGSDGNERHDSRGSKERGDPSDFPPTPRKTLLENDR